MIKKEELIKEVNLLNSQINNCIDKIIDCRLHKRNEDEVRHQMESLLVATQQDLSCILDYLNNEEY